LRNPLVVAAAADVLFANPVVGALAPFLAGAVPIERQGSALASFRAITELVNAGYPLLIFPHGKCSEDGSVGDFQPGFGLLSRISKAQVVLVAIQGSREVLPLERRRPRRGAVRLHFDVPRTYAHESPEAFATAMQVEMVRLQDSLSSQLAK
jgi:1-acyl-sn-glycerol-3-phosphate acyltransferase